MTDTDRDALLDELLGELARLRRAADVSEISQVVARYGPLVDSGSADATAALWAQDGSYSVGGLLELNGRAAIAEMVHSPMHQGFITNGAGHVLTAPTVTVDGDTAVAYNHSLLITADGDGFAIHRLTANKWVLSRTTDGWQISERINHVLDGNAAARELFAAAAP
ncbi:nuclear transport factor 2 family protein [Nocardioides sp. Bht2]|uniref:nuclear transport factor 2 family protein n=1 Tax=Nocardioides sp. Bht2 TaxID=3392297 RepID=UPI0039B4FCA8